MGWKLISSIAPHVGLKPLSASSDVIRTATMWPSGALVGPRTKSSGVVSVGSASYSRRMSGMACSGMPMPIISWQDGMLTWEMPSVTGCSTCRRGLSSRKQKSPVSGLKRYSTVAAPT